MIIITNDLGEGRQREFRFYPRHCMKPGETPCVMLSNVVTRKDGIVTRRAAGADIREGSKIWKELVKARKDAVSKMNRIMDKICDPVPVYADRGMVILRVSGSSDVRIPLDGDQTYRVYAVESMDEVSELLNNLDFKAELSGTSIEVLPYDCKDKNGNYDSPIELFGKDKKSDFQLYYDDETGSLIVYKVAQ